MIYKLSPSLLDEYRVVKQGLYNKTGEDLRRYMLKDFEVNEAISRGRAYHELLEFGGDKYRSEDGSYQVYESELDRLWIFPKNVADPALQVRREYPGLLFELWVDHDTEYLGTPVKIRQRLDGLNGLHLHEFKTTSRKPKATDYNASVQWKINLLSLPQAIDIRYHIFQISKRLTYCKKTSFVFERYDDLKKDVDDQIKGFISWVLSQDDERLLDRITLKVDKNVYKDI